MSLRALLVAAALSGVAIAHAYAADQSVPSGPGGTSYYPNAYYPTSIRWTGFYVGLNLGGAWSSAHASNPFSGLSESPQAGFTLGGAQIGFNWQWDSLVFGMEADLDWTGLNGSATDAKGYVNSVSTNSLATVTGRVGYALNQILVYGKGGIAFTNEANSVKIPPRVYVPPNAPGVDPIGLTVTSQAVATGWTIGAGLEYAFDPHWSARFEYDFVDFPSHSYSLSGNSSAYLTPPGKTCLNSVTTSASFISCPFHNQGSTDLSMQKIVAGINYRF